MLASTGSFAGKKSNESLLEELSITLTEQRKRMSAFDYKKTSKKKKKRPPIPRILPGTSCHIVRSGNTQRKPTSFLPNNKPTWSASPNSRNARKEKIPGEGRGCITLKRKTSRREGSPKTEEKILKLRKKKNSRREEERV